LFVFISFGPVAPSGPWPPYSRGFCITQRRTTVGRIPLDEWSARRRDFCLIYNAHNRQKSMHLLGFKPTVSTDGRSQTHALDHAAAGIGSNLFT